MSTTKADAVYVVVERGGPHTRTERIANKFDINFTSSLASLTNAGLTLTSQVPHPVVMGIAVDATNNLVWFFNPWFGGWNLGRPDGTFPVGNPNWAGGSQNPSTPVGGWTMQSTAGYTPGNPIFPTFFLNYLPDNLVATSITINCGASPFIYAVPTGYSAWGAAVTLDPGNTGAHVILSGGNLTAVSDGTVNPPAGGGATTLAQGFASGKHYMEVTINAIGTSGTYNALVLALSNGDRTQYPNYPSISAFGGYANLLNIPSPAFGFNFNLQTDGTFPAGCFRSTMTVQGASTGKYYWEITMARFAGPTLLEAVVGIANHNQVLSEPFGGQGWGFLGDNTGNGIGWGSDATVKYNFISIGGAGAYHGGTTVGIAADFDNHLVWFWNPELNRWNDDILANQNPSLGIGGYSFAGMTYPAFPAATVLYWTTGGTPDDILDGNWGQAPFLNAQPAGFGTFFSNRTLTIPPGFTIERMDNRIWPTVENCWCVDCGFTLTQPTPAADLTVSAV
jgi:hypothetical protein